MPRKTVIDAPQVNENQLILKEVGFSGVSNLEAVRFNGTVFVQAQADAAATSDFIGIADSIVADVGDLVVSGRLDGYTSLTPGAVYYLSAASPGQITSTSPSSNRIPVGIAVSATELLIQQGGSWPCDGRRRR